MTVFLHRLSRALRPPNPVPVQLQQTFHHLYADMAWFGILSGTTIAFLAVYATRQGASSQQIGLLSAVPALVNLLFALPAGSWLGRQPMGRTVFWSSVLTRAFYLLLVPLPVLLAPKTQVWTIIFITLLLNIPGTYMLVGFNALFGEAVPLEWRGYMMGIRNALLSVVSTVFTLGSGELLNRVPFPLGYQIVFAIGVLGAAMSSYHLFRLSSHVGKQAGAGSGAALSVPPNGRRPLLQMRGLYQRGLESLRLDALNGNFARILALLFGWHLMQFMTIPVITPFVVNQLKLKDQYIGLAGALFNTTTLIGSLLLNQATIRFGNKRVTGGGVMGVSLFPILTALGPVGYLLGNLFGGFAWSMVGGAIYNYLLENIPDFDRPAYLAWYGVVSNAAILIGSLSGPLIAGTIGFSTALLIFGIGRFFAGTAILKWG